MCFHCVVCLDSDYSMGLVNLANVVRGKINVSRFFAVTIRLDTQKPDCTHYSLIKLTLANRRVQYSLTTS